jgi:hypothetical protein
MDDLLPDLQAILDGAEVETPDYPTLKADLIALADKVRKRVGLAKHYLHAWQAPYPNKWVRPLSTMVAQHLNQPVGVFNTLATIEAS